MSWFSRDRLRKQSERIVYASKSPAQGPRKVNGDAFRNEITPEGQPRHRWLWRVNSIQFRTINHAILFNKTDPWAEDALPVLRRELIGITALLAVRPIVDSVHAKRASHGQDCSGQRRPRVGRRRSGGVFVHPLAAQAPGQKPYSRPV